LSLTFNGYDIQISYRLPTFLTCLKTLLEAIFLQVIQCQTFTGCHSSYCSNYVHLSGFYPTKHFASLVLMFTRNIMPPSSGWLPLSTSQRSHQLHITPWLRPWKGPLLQFETPTGLGQVPSSFPLPQFTKSTQTFPYKWHIFFHPIISASTWTSAVTPEDGGSIFLHNTGTNKAKLYTG